MRPVAAWLVVLAACGGTAGTDQSLTVSAAASLGEAFERIAVAFEEEHPSVQVVLNLAGSQVLAGQILEGAPVDVFASADDTQMGRVVEAGMAAGQPTVFAANGLAIAVEGGNPLGIRRLADLADPDLVVVLAAEDVPIGRYARLALLEAGVTVEPDSLEPDVRAVLSRVELGEADAGIVYRSDLTRRGDITGLPIESAVRARYPIAPLTSSSNADLASDFVRFLAGPTARGILEDHGFEAP